MKVLTHILVVSLAMFLLASSGAALDYAALGFSPPLASSLDSSDVVFSDEAANDSLTVTVQDELIYRYGHYSLDGGPWHRFELSGERLYGDWIPGDCGASLAFSATTFDLQPGEVGTDNYVLTYSCSYASGGWGCHDGLWQLLQFNVSLNAAAAEEEPVVAGRCLAGDVYWFDDSGVPLDVKDACGVNETCLDGACVGEPASTGNVILVESPGEHNDIGPNLLAAFGNASAGDTVLLPAGSFRVVGKVYYDVRDKPGLHLKGAGSGPNGTRLYRDYETSDSMLSLVSTSGLPEVEVSDIWFQGMKVRLNDTDTGSTYPSLVGIGFTYVDPYVHDCRFQWFTSRAISIIHRDPSVVSGLITNNEFLDCTTLQENGFSMGYGVAPSVYSCDSWYDVSPGGSDTVFIEDNLFSGQRHAVASCCGGRYVFRHNVVGRNTRNAAVDMHGGQPEWNEAYYPAYKYSTRFTEVYGNTFIATPSDDSIFDGRNYGAIGNRGGAQLIWGNTFKNYSLYSIRLLIAYNYWADPDRPPDGWTIPDYPVPYQVGWESGDAYGGSHSGTDPSTYGAGDVFIWNNTYDESVGVSIGGHDDHHPDEYVVEGRDWHLVARPGYSPYTYPHPRRQ